MKQNKNHVLKIKELSERLLGKNKFEMDLTIIPRINGDISNLKYRLSRKEILELRNSDAAIKRCEKKLYKACTAYKRPRGSLFRCSAGTNAFSIDPFGTLTACPWVKKYSCSLKDTTFKKGFYYVLSEARKKKYTTKSKCKNCKFLNVCGICPARAYLETGNEENPAEYYCRLAD